MKARCFVCCAAILGIGTATVFSQAPPNDNFDNRAVLSGNSVSFSGSLSNATLESGEPPLLFPSYPTNGSIWWSWTATASTPVIVSVSRDYAAGAMVSAALEVFSGTNLASLQGLDYTSFNVPAGRYLKFMAGAGSNYQFRVSGYWPGAVSAQLTASTNPVIIQQPQSCTVSPYGSAAFYVIAAGIPDPAYQWLLNGVAIPGQAAPTLAVHSLTNTGGSYSVVVSNSGGSVESSAAIVTVIETNPVPVVLPLAATNISQVPFILTGEPGRWYQFELSSNLVNWNHDSPWLGYWYGQSTNSSTFFTVPRLDQRKQFMKVSLNVDKDVCVAQLKAMSAALNLAAIAMKRSPIDWYTFELIEPYVQLETNGELPYCPNYGAYVAGATFTNPPVCTLSSAAGHIIP